MNLISDLKIKLTAETAKFTQEINKARNSLNGLSNTSGKINLTKIAIVGLTTAALAAGAAFTAMASYASQGISVYAETEKYMARTEAQLKATGAAVGYTASELDSFARSVAMNTLASTDGVRSAMSIMMTFKSVTGDTFKTSIKLAQDMAAAFGTDISTEARNLGRALESPAEAVSILKRKGIELTSSQQDLIKSFVESGEKAKAQEIILESLQNRVAGAGEAEAKDTVAGALDTLGQATEELKEAFATATGITDTFKGAINGLAKAFIWLKEKMVGTSDTKAYISDLEKTISKTEEYLKTEKERAALAKSTNMYGIDHGGNDYAVSLAESQLKEAKDKLAKARADLLKQEAEAEARKKEAEDNRAAHELAEKQQAGAKVVDTITGKLQSRSEKLTAQYNKDKAAIEKIVLTEEEIRRQGFDNIEQLRASLSAKLEAQYNKELADLNKKESKKTGIKKSASKDQLATLDLHYANEMQKIDLNHQQQLAKIAKMSISEAQAKERGFATALELRKHYIALENNAYEKAVQAQKNKLEKEQKQRTETVRKFFNDIRGSGGNQYAENDIKRDDQLVKAKELHDQLLLSVEQYEQAKAMIEDEYRNRKEQLDRDVMASQLNAAASLFDGLAGVAEASVGKQSAVYQTLFAISKSFQIAESMINLQSAIMKAMDDPTATTTAERFANMAAVASRGAAVLNQLTSITLSGARATGGYVGGGQAYLVGEKGPEIFVPGASGQITSNDNLNKALGGGGNSVVVYQTNNFDSGNADNAQLAKIIAKATEDKVYQVLSRESRAGGMFNG